ncbi:MAG TPA: putative ATP-grasp-modified RiPP [Streptosporangiaceae bacterium]|jgi:putative ATP-grasp target RiPP
MTTMTQRPWGLTRITDRYPEAPPCYASVALDPESQLAVYRDADGQIIEMGKHGTNSSSSTASRSGGGDGARPQPQTDDDTTADMGNDD